MFRLRLEQKIPVTVCLVCCVCVLFSKANSKWRMSISYRLCCHNILFLRTMCGECCCREISLVNQKLAFDERISCITRQDDFSPKNYRTVSLQVAPSLGDCRGYRRDPRAVQTDRKTSEFLSSDSSWTQIGILIEKNFFSVGAALPYDPFRSKEITDVSIINDYFDFHTALGFATT